MAVRLSMHMPKFGQWLVLVAAVCFLRAGTPSFSVFWLLNPRHRLCDILTVLNRAQAAWFLKAKSLAEEARIDEAEMEDEGIAEMLIDENATAQVPRPGTSFTRPVTGSGPSQGVRPMSKGGRPVSGYLRPGTQGGRPSTVEAAMRGRTATARPVTSASGRYVRLGTVRANSALFSP